MADTALRKWQIGIENPAAYGTEVAATRPFYPGPGSALTRAYQWHTPNVDIGSYDEARAGRFQQLIEAGASIVDMPLDVRQIVEFLQMAVKGAVTGVQQGATAAYLWTWTPGDTLASASIEWDASGEEYTLIGAKVDELKIKWAVGEPVMVSATLIGKNRNTNSLAGALSAFAITPLQGWEAKLYIDAIGGTALTTNIASTLISGEITISNNLTRRYFDDNTQALGALGRGTRRVEASIVADLNAAALTEIGNLETPTNRLVAVRFGDNKVIEGAYKEKVDIVIPGQWTADVIGDEDGSSTVEFTLENIYSTDQSYSLSIAVQNDRAT